MTIEEFNTLQAVTSERGQQQALMEWAAYKEGETPALRMLFHPANGGFRRKATAVRLKKMGVKAGVPDLFLAYPASGFHGLFIEMKSESGRLRESQKWWRDRLTEAGFAWACCRSWIEGKDVLVSYLDGTLAPTPLGAPRKASENGESST